MESKANMGVPEELTGYDTIFCRAFRFGFKSTHLNEAFVRRVKIDHFNQKLYLEIYQVFTGQRDAPAQEFITNLESDGELLVYDGCGTVLYTIKLLGMALEGHEVSFDYANSDVSVDVLKLGYKKEIRTCPYLEIAKNLPKVHMLPKGPSEDLVWKINIGDKEYVLDEMKRPSLKIEEILIPHKNGNLFLPGKACWESSKLKILTDDELNLDNVKECTIRLYITNIVREEWRVTEILGKEVDSKTKGVVTWAIRFGCVHYKHHEIL